MKDIVWIIDIGVYGRVQSRHAYYSVVEYMLSDHMYIDIFDNNDLIEWEKYSFDYITDADE